MTGRLLGKIAMISGAASSAPGLSVGRATALLFAREGAQIFAIDANEAELRATVDEVAAEGGSIDSAVVDIRDPSAIEKAVEQCIERFGVIDVLDNNVGVGSTGGLVAIAEEEWSRVVDTNLIGTRNVCRAVLPVMEKEGAAP